MANIMRIGGNADKGLKRVGSYAAGGKGGYNNEFVVSYTLTAPENAKYVVFCAGTKHSYSWGATFKINNTVVYSSENSQTTSNINIYPVEPGDSCYVYSRSRETGAGCGAGIMFIGEDE